MSQFTPWFKMSQRPVREGEYEGRERGSRARVPVFWRTLQDTTEPGWYYRQGNWGPFLLWADVGDTITAWRGLTEQSK